MAVYHIIGDQDTVLGFRFAGVTGEVVNNRAEAQEVFRNCLRVPDCRILLLTEAAADMLDEELSAHKLSAKSPYVAVVEDIWGPQGERPSIQAMIYDAIGIRIIEEK